VGLLAACLPLASVGCFGRFELVRKVYELNKQVSPDPWVRWLAFLALNIVPVYGIATTVDLIVANSLEFWTGENPVVATPRRATRRIRAADGSLVTLTLRADRSIAVAVEHGDGMPSRFSLAREGGSVVARAEDGTLVARVADVGGRPALIEGTLAHAGAP
jgi:hypothetical protein